MKKALITGINGQDGSYLSEFLIEKGYVVHGILKRNSVAENQTARLDNVYNKIQLHYGDLTDMSSLISIIQKVMPDEIYNLAAQSHVRISFDQPIYTSQVTGIGTLNLLEAVKLIKPNTKIYQASSSELYGSTPPPQNELTPFHPRSPYGAAKIFSYWSTVNYREAYGMHASNGILFNHESPRRGETFVTRKITRAVARIAAGIEKEVYLGNLDAVRDWGYAKEYVEAMWLMLQQNHSDDFVVGTGVGASVLDFCKEVFSTLELDYREYVVSEERYMRPTEVDALIADASKIKTKLDWVAETHWQELAKLMSLADFKSLSHEK